MFWYGGVESNGRKRCQASDDQEDTQGSLEERASKCDKPKMNSLKLPGMLGDLARASSKNCTTELIRAKPWMFWYGGVESNGMLSSRTTIYGLVFL
jgi:hypothetical protein